MTNSTPAGLKIEYDNSGGSLVDITQDVLNINDFNVEQLLENSRSYGDAWEEFKPIGVGKVVDVELSGNYDDTAATSPNALMGGRIPEAPGASTRTLKITWIASGKYSQVETHLVNFKRTPMREGLTKWSAKLRPTGAVTEG